jgi:hypothetical protein
MINLLPIIVIAFNKNSNYLIFHPKIIIKTFKIKTFHKLKII